MKNNVPIRLREQLRAERTHEGVTEACLNRIAAEVEDVRSHAPDRAQTGTLVSPGLIFAAPEIGSRAIVR